MAPRVFEDLLPEGGKWACATVKEHLGATRGYRKGETCYVWTKPRTSDSGDVYTVFSGNPTAHWQLLPAAQCLRMLIMQRQRHGGVNALVYPDDERQARITKDMRWHYEDLYGNGEE